MMNKIKKHINSATIIALVAVLLIVVIYACAGEQLTYAPVDVEVDLEVAARLEEDIAKLDLTNVDSLMIVAHPDDETIWGGDHLRNGHYLVICITDGSNDTRRKEFESVMQRYNTTAIMLNYPDKTNGKKDRWTKVKALIKQDLDYAIGYKDWTQVVTHNPDGEYGHIHHKMTNALVTRTMVNNSETDKLMYFGKYYRESQMESHKDDPGLQNPLNTEDLEFKKDVCSLYSSQSLVMLHLGHMFPYENWISYADWK